MNLRTAAIAVTAIAAAAAIVGMARWEYPSHREVAPATAQEAATQPLAASAWTAPAQMAATVQNTSAELPRPQQSVSASAEQQSAEEVPVRFKLRRDASASAATAILKNELGEPITVTVSAVNAASGTASTVQVTIEANRNSNLTEAGLLVASNDRITIQSPPYRDQVFEAN